MNIGTVLRRIRKERKLTLKIIAEKASISEGFLSQVENNVNSPSVETLIRICGALGIDAGELLTRAGKQEKFIIIRKSEWQELDLPHTGFVTHRFFPPEERTIIDSSILAIAPGKSIPARKNIKNSQELISVLQGSVRLTHAHLECTLAAGDTVHLWSDPASQRITNDSSLTSFVLWVGTL